MSSFFPVAFESRSGYLSAAVSYLSTFITSLSSNGIFINLETHNSSYYALKYESRLSSTIITNNILYFVIRYSHYRVKITSSTVMHGLISLLTRSSFRKRNSIFRGEIERDIESKKNSSSIDRIMRNSYFCLPCKIDRSSNTFFFFFTIHSKILYDNSIGTNVRELILPSR